MASLVSGDGVQSCSEAEVNSAQESAVETIEKLSLRSQFPEVTIEGDSFNSGQFAMILGGLAETRDSSRAFYRKSPWERIMREIDQAEPLHDPHCPAIDAREENGTTPWNYAIPGKITGTLDRKPQ